jgi:predicted MFS family arabinose efflux permease
VQSSCRGRGKVVSLVESAMASAVPGAPAGFTRYQKFVIAVLAFLQFTIVLDFMILSPLGALLMDELDITAPRFGLVVSAYAFSAGASGLFAAGFADRFDRKRLLMFFYVGFVLGTFLCGIAPSYYFLLGARMVTGLFGGVIGAVSFAIIADLFPLQMRGRVMGVVQTSFAASQVMGIPLGLFLSNHWGWHAPFLMIVVVSVVVGVIIWVGLQPIRGHLALQRAGNPLAHVARTLSRPRYVLGYSATAILVIGGFMLMPFGSAFTVHNLGIPLDDLPLIYMVTGVFSLVTGPLVGRLSDSLGKYAMFCAGSLLALVVVLFYTRLGVTPMWEVILVNVLLFTAVSARMVSSSALTSAVPDPADRGAFMAVSSSLQQLAGGVASGLAGLIVVQSADGTMLHYEQLGHVVTAAIIVTMAVFYFIDRDVKRRLNAAAPTSAPAAAS